MLLKLFQPTRLKSAQFFLVIFLSSFCALLASCGQTNSVSTPPPPLPSDVPTQIPYTQTPTPTSTPTIQPSPTIQRTPPPLPYPYQSSYLNPLDYPHTYIQDACEYLRLKWDPANSQPGTVVMILMFHSLSADAVYTDPAHMNSGPFNHAMNTLHEQGFEAIDMEQFVAFLETNAKIPPRSVLIISDDRHQRQYFDNFFYPLYEKWNWPVINAWISNPDQGGVPTLWEQNQQLAEEGWVDYQAHGVIHYPILNNSTDDYIMGELQGSIDFMQSMFNKTPVAFIWPGGNFTQRSVQLARYQGYKVGFTVNPRGPIMFNWVPLADEADPHRPSYLAEGSMNDPLLVLPRYWPVQIVTELDAVRVMGKEAAAYAESNKAIELEYYDIVCAPALGSIPTLTP